MIVNKNYSTWDIFALARTVINKMTLRNLIIHIMIEFLIVAIVLPFVLRIANKSIISGTSIHTGIILHIVCLLAQVLNKFYSTHFLQKYIGEFDIKLTVLTDDLLARECLKFDWDVIESFDAKALGRAKNNVGWSVSNFIKQITTQFISFFPIIGYTWLLFIISPLSVIICVCGMSISIIYFKKDRKEMQVYRESWDRFNQLDSGMFTSLIHHKADESLNEMLACKEKSLRLKRIDATKHDVYLQNVNTTYDIIFIFNLLVFFMGSSLDITTIIIYLQYVALIKSNLSYFCSVYKSYKQTLEDVAKLTDLLGKHDPREPVSQIKKFQQITINRLHHVYSEKNTFRLTLDQRVNISIGQIVQLLGDSGNGKTTLMNIIAGVIPHKRYEHDVCFDGVFCAESFDAITTHRVYSRQFESESVHWPVCIYDIVTGTEYQKGTNPPDLDTVHDALRLAACADFVDIDCSNPNLVSIFKEKHTLSGGQKGRICIARTIYQMIRDDPSVVILDEIDKSVQAVLAELIMNNIFSFCRTNKILCLVTAHSTEVKQMAYDLCLEFKQGTITIRK
jgi:zinc transport system ATP-binding protein